MEGDQCNDRSVNTLSSDRSCRDDKDLAAHVKSIMDLQNMRRAPQSLTRGKHLQQCARHNVWVVKMVLGAREDVYKRQDILCEDEKGNHSVMWSSC